ncbi:MAG: DUF3426 domain-containing protein [Methylococcales bacterium]|nr:DUF3426 domain-containing protein [Methylococcales bacterium]
MVHTTCPLCNKQHPITEKKLKTLDDDFLCKRCYTSFNPRKQLSRNHLFPRGGYLKDGTPDKFYNYYKYGLLACVLVFMFQIYHFEADTLVHNKTLRPWLNKLSSILNYPLVPYKNIDEFTILNVSFKPSGKDKYTLKTSFINQSDFPQNKPFLKLALIDYVGTVFAERTFLPHYYSQNNEPIPPNKLVDIEMIFAAPEDAKKIGGYRIELI